jgi:hypothetical protein
MMRRDMKGRTVSEHPWDTDCPTVVRPVDTPTLHDRKSGKGSTSVLKPENTSVTLA